MTDSKQPQKGRIFISYRRVDTSYAAGRIYDRLVAKFGKDAIFMDVDAIEGGVDFVKVLEDAVQSCDVLIALIGKQWLGTKDKAGRRRLDDPEDFVRIEIATALKRNIRLIPVLVDGVEMPQQTDLPDNLKALARRNALQVNHHSFNPDVNRLIEHSESALVEAEESRVTNARALQVARENAAREKAEGETAEKAPLEVEKIEVKPVPVKPKAGIQIAYWFGGFIVLVLGIIFLSSLNNPTSTPQPIPEDTQIQAVETSTQETVELIETATPKSTPRSTIISVLATSNWYDTKLMVKANQKIKIKYISGHWTMDSNNYPIVDGNGYPEVKPEDICATCAAPSPNTAYGTLVARIGSDIYVVGNYKEIIAKTDGSLLLMINDEYDYLFDNSGSLNVKITIEN